MGDSIAFLMKDAVWLLLVLTSIIMLPILAVGLLVGIFQAATQIQEMTLSFIPKFAILIVVIVLFGPLMANLWVELSTKIVRHIMVI